VKYTSQIYYFIKPLIPRKLQILLRQMVVKKKLTHYKHIWPIDPAAGTPPPGWKGWPGNKKFALVLTHDVDTAKGQQKSKQLADLEKYLGFRSSFNFVPKRYDVQPEIRKYLINNSFEVGEHGLYHDGKYYTSREVFRSRALQINNYLKEWGAVGFRSPSMLHNLEWIHDLNIEYDASTFDTDPFEPQSDGVGTIFPFWVEDAIGRNGYVELPYTLPQDFTLFVLMQERTIEIWKKKIDWIVEQGGMALVNVHPDYTFFGRGNMKPWEYPAHFYDELLSYIRNRYEGQYWHALPREIAEFWKQSYNNV
jgi:hypothetical protein